MHRVSFHPSGVGVQVPPGSTLLEAALAAGLPIARACGAEGLCGRCGIHVVAGALHLEAESEGERVCKRRNRLDAEMRLACLARVHGDVVVSATYW